MKTPRSKPSGEERGKPPLLLQQQLHAGMRTLESTSIPTGDATLSAPAFKLGLAQFTLARSTPSPSPRALCCPQGYVRHRPTSPYLPPSTHNQQLNNRSTYVYFCPSSSEVGQLSPTLYPTLTGSRYLAPLVPSRLPRHRLVPVTVNVRLLRIRQQPALTLPRPLV